MQIRPETRERREQKGQPKQRAGVGEREQHRSAAAAAAAASEQSTPGPSDFVCFIDGQKTTDTPDLSYAVNYLEMAIQAGGLCFGPNGGEGEDSVRVSCLWVEGDFAQQHEIFL